MKRDKKQYRILVIEDNPGDFVIVEDLLTEQISLPAITHVVNYNEAFDILAAGTIFDIILLDLSLPDKNGQDLIASMLLIAPAPVIILTGYTDIDFSIKSISLGIFDYLLKDDLTSAALYKSIIYAIERKKNVSILQESEKRYSDLFQLSPQPMFVFDIETYMFVQVNKAAIDLYGYTEAEFMKITLMDVKQEEDIAYTKLNIKKPHPADEIYKSTVMHHKKSGELIEVEIYSTPITINDKNLRMVIAIDVTEKKQYEHKITKAIIKTQEDERYEIGGELHDNVCQILAASQINLGMLKRSLEPASLQMFDECKENISMALAEIRNLSHRLAPVFFEESTMEEAFQRLFNTFNIEKKLEMSLHFDDAVGKYPLSLEIQLNLYRILQEQLRNIQKYAKAGIIDVHVIISNNKLRMKISDNGIGFNIHAVKGGIGLANMKRRAELFSGKFEIDSSPGNGCTIIIDIPLQEIHEVATIANAVF